MKLWLQLTDTTHIQLGLNANKLISFGHLRFASLQLLRIQVQELNYTAICN